MPPQTGLAKTHFLENADLRTLLEPAPSRAVPAASKVACTLGPACRDVDTLEKLLNAGMTAARVDLTVWSPLITEAACATSAPDLLLYTALFPLTTPSVSGGNCTT